jgi:hypothetical protein
VDKDYHKEREFVNGKADEFYDYIHQCLLGEKALRLLESVARQTDVYVFSGVIRNFLLGYPENRDVDVVIANIGSLKLDIDELLPCRISRNSFGGYKLHVDNLSVDAWGIEFTWGIMEKKLRLTPNSLIKTAFFNFSAIVYDYNHRRFIFGQELCEFLRTRAMDIVFPENPNKTLCVINAIHFAKLYGFSLSYGLCRWIDKYYNINMPFDEVQERHFHRKMVSTDEREWFYKVVHESLVNGLMKKNRALHFDFIQKQAKVSAY